MLKPISVPPAPTEVTVNTMLLAGLAPPPKLAAAIVMVSLMAYPEPKLVAPTVPLAPTDWPTWPRTRTIVNSAPVPVPDVADWVTS